MRLQDSGSGSPVIAGWLEYVAGSSTAGLDVFYSDASVITIRDGLITMSLNRVFLAQCTACGPWRETSSTPPVCTGSARADPDVASYAWGCRSAAWFCSTFLGLDSEWATLHVVEAPYGHWHSRESGGQMDGSDKVKGARFILFSMYFNSGEQRVYSICWNEFCALNLFLNNIQRLQD